MNKPPNSLVTIVKARMKRTHKKFAQDLWIVGLMLGFLGIGFFLFWLLDQWLETFR